MPPPLPPASSAAPAVESSLADDDVLAILVADAALAVAPSESAAAVAAAAADAGAGKALASSSFSAATASSAAAASSFSAASASAASFSSAAVAAAAASSSGAAGAGAVSALVPAGGKGTVPMPPSADLKIFEGKAKREVSEATLASNLRGMTMQNLLVSYYKQILFYHWQGFIAELGMSVAEVNAVTERAMRAIGASGVRSAMATSAAALPSDALAHTSELISGATHIAEFITLQRKLSDQSALLASQTCARTPSTSAFGRRRRQSPGSGARSRASTRRTARASSRVSRARVRSRSGGFKALRGQRGPQRFTLERGHGSPDALPQSHTCFNSLELTPASSFEATRDKLLLAIREGSEGFAMI